MKSKSIYIKVIVSIIVLIGLGYGISSVLENNVAIQKAQAKEAQNLPITAVETQKVEVKSVAISLSATGVFVPFEQLELLSETDGKVQSIDFELNTIVNKGQILAKVEAQSKQTQFKIAELNYSKAKRDFERFEALFKNNNLSEYDLENARFQMQNAEQNLNLARQALDFTLIKSPIAGTISQKHISIGKVLGMGSPVAVITDISQLRLFVNLSAQDLDKVKVGQKVSISIPVRNTENFSGTVKSIAVQSTDAGTFPVEILMSNQNTKPVLAGMNAEVLFADHAEKVALLIPRIALIDQQVFVVENGKAVAKKVQIGKEYGEDVEILGGLQAGETVIVKGQNNLENGQIIQIQ